MDEWIVDLISFQKIFGLCGLKCHIVEIWRDVTLVDDGRRTDGRTDFGEPVDSGESCDSGEFGDSGDLHENREYCF